MTWSVKKLEEVCEKIKKEKASIGEIPYIEIGNIDVNNKKIIFTGKGAVNGSVYAPANSILISRVRPTRGAVAFIDKKLAVSSAFTIIKPKPEYNPKLLFYFLAWNRKFFDYLGEKQKGTNYPSVREKDVLEFEISFPENKEEQQKIVKILDAIQSAVEIQEKIIEKTKELKKSLMAELFKYGAPSFRKGRKLKKTEIGEIPEDWEVVRLGDKKIAEIKYGKGKPPEGGKIPVIGSSGIYDWTNKALIEKPTIIIGRKGTAGIPHLSMLPCWPSDTAFYLDLNLEKINPKFLYEYILFRPLSGEHAKTTLPSLKREDLETFKIPLPTLPEQQEIAEILQTIDQKIEIEKRKKELYEELFKTMLNKIMNQEIDINLLNY
jgi:type I restriction enzyme S subunit